MATPTPSQLAAMTSADEHVLVSAGAGTGKTTTVVGRILYLLGVPVEGRRIAEPVGLRDIAAITYTNAAAADLKRKLREQLREHGRRDEAYEIDAARIGTIHGFCGAILREFALRIRRNPGARVMEEGESSALAVEAIHESLLTTLERRSVPDLNELFARYEVAKVKEWTRLLVGDSARLRRFAARRDELDRPTRALVDFAVIAQREVERRLIDAGALDFDRMIVWTHELLAGDESVRLTLQRRIRTLIVDEFQDVDPSQRDIAYLLGAPH
ncbi:MAG TPA: UvrD-helicase domain-containing protein, partial [Gemmatimonadales bacterium]